MSIARYGTSVLVAGIITFLLFFLMHILIATGERAIQDDVVGYRVEIGQVQRDDDVKTRERKPEKLEEPQAPPEMPDIPKVDTDLPDVDGMNMAFSGRFSPNLDGAGTGIGAPTDGDYLPIVLAQPIYPRRATERGIEGYVIVELTVTTAGTTEDVRVIEAEPSGIFDSAAIRAAEKFRYKPKVVNGQPIPVSGVLYRFTFELED